VEDRQEKKALDIGGRGKDSPRPFVWVFSCASSLNKMAAPAIYELSDQLPGRTGSTHVFLADNRTSHQAEADLT
jgi:hypothetical protein